MKNQQKTKNIGEGLMREMEERRRSAVVVPPQPEQTRFSYSEPVLKYLIARAKKPNVHPDCKAYIVYDKPENMRTPADKELIEKLESKRNYSSAMYSYNVHLKAVAEENKKTIFDPGTKKNITIGEFRKKYDEVGEQFVREYLDNEGNTSQESFIALKKYISSGITPTMITNTSKLPVSDADIDRRIKAEVQKAGVETKPEDYVEPIPDGLTGQAAIDVENVLHDGKKNEENLFEPLAKLSKQKKYLKGYSELKNSTMDNKQFRIDSMSTLSMYFYIRAFIKWSPSIDDEYKMYKRYTTNNVLAASIGFRKIAREFDCDPKTAYAKVQEMIKFGWIKTDEQGLDVGKPKDQNIYKLGYIKDGGYNYFIDDVYAGE